MWTSLQRRTSPVLINPFCISALWLYLERVRVVDVDKSTARDSSCINQSLLHISTVAVSRKSTAADVNKSTAKDISCINQSLLHISTPWPPPVVIFVYANCIDLKCIRTRVNLPKNLEQLFKIDARTTAYLKRRINILMRHPSENNVLYNMISVIAR